MPVRRRLRSLTALMAAVVALAPMAACGGDDRRDPQGFCELRRVLNDPKAEWARRLDSQDADEVRQGLRDLLRLTRGMRDVAPTEIAADVKIAFEATEQFVAVSLRVADPVNPSPADQATVNQVTARFEAERYREAEARLRAYGERKCGPLPTTTTAPTQGSD